MSLSACFASLRAAGKLGQDDGAYIEDLYNKLRAKLEKQFGDGAAAALASEQALDLAVAELAERKRRTVLQIAAQQGALDKMGRYRGRDGKWDFGRAAEALLVRDERAPYSNVEYRSRAIREGHLGLLSDLIEHHGRNLVGQVRDKAGLGDILTELYGLDSGNPLARGFTRAWQDVAERLRLRANAAGASIIKLEGWRLPQNHDPAKVRMAAGVGESMDDAFATWRDFITPLLDRDAMLDRETGQPLDGEDLDAVLRYSFNSIVTDGWAHREEGAGGSPSVAARLSNSRVLAFKDPASWQAYQDEFGGNTTLYDALMGHVSSMSRDIAQMEILGPNPAATVRWLKDTVQKRAAVEHGAGSDQFETARKSARTIQSLYDTLAGANRLPDSRKLAEVGEALRALQTASKLGSAVLSTTSDVATGILTRGYNGLPMMDVASGYAKYLNPLNHAERMQAQRMGFVAEQTGAMISAHSRFTGTEMTNAVTRTMADATLRMSGLNAVTEAGRWTWGMGMLSWITHERGQAFDQLDDAFRGMFERYGLDASAWDVIRDTQPVHENGGEWIKPEHIQNSALRTRLMEMIFQEMDVAVPTSGVRTQAMMNNMAPKGSVKGEIARSLFQFKAFPVTVMAIQWQRAMAQAEFRGKLTHFAAFFALSAVAGGFSVLMKDISKGKNPRPIGSPAFLLEAVAQGGGAGIYGDFVRSTESRFQSGVMQVLAGPSVQTVDNLGRLTIGNALAAAKGERTHVERDLFNIARSDTPVVGSLWWLRPLFQRELLDQWRAASDPQAPQAFARMRRADLRDRNQSYWWAPGEIMPSEAPQLGEVFNAAPAPKPAKPSQGW